jgi:hypothetical protein
VTEGYKEDDLVVNDKAALTTKLDNHGIVSGIVDSDLV